MRVGLLPRINLGPITLFAVAFASVLLFSKLASVDPARSDDETSPPVVVPPAKSVTPRFASTPHSINAAPGTNIAGEAVPKERAAAEDGAPYEINVPDVMSNGGSLTTLAATVRDDNNTANRLQAMRALSTLADQGIEVPYIRDVLRIAAADTDSDVADHAKDAYDHLIQRDDSIQPEDSFTR